MMSGIRLKSNKWFVYLIHFQQTIGTAKHSAQHYIGSTNNVPGRLQRHRSGRGARILQYCNKTAIDYNVIRVWLCSDQKTAMQWERQLKRYKNSKKLCPKCNPKTAMQYMRSDYNDYQL